MKFAAVPPPRGRRSRAKPETSFRDAIVLPYALSAATQFHRARLVCRTFSNGGIGKCCRRSSGSDPMTAEAEKPSLVTGCWSAEEVCHSADKVRRQCAGHRSFVSKVTANDSFHILQTGTTDPERTSAQRSRA